MPRSPRHRELVTRLGELRDRLLPRRFDPTGTYSDRQYDRFRGYRVLAHAEIEACLEDLGVQTVNSAFNGWWVDRQPRACLVALLAYYDGRLGGPPEQLMAPGGSGPLRDRVKLVRDSYVRWVTVDNHGIREKNVLAILLPLGVLESDIDPAWLSTIDSFGAARGGTAHRSGRTQQPPDPADELQSVRDIVDGLAQIDAKLSLLQRPP